MSYSSSTKIDISTSGENILALDFDGVICASSTESSYSSILAAGKQWPTKLPKPDQTDFGLIKAVVNNVRPIIETGYENILVARYSYENLIHFSEMNPNSSTADFNEWVQTMTNDITSRWNPTFRDKLIFSYNSTKPELIQLFGSMRDELIANDLDHWIGLNGLYPTVSKSLQSVSKRYEGDTSSLFKFVYIVTTKQERFVRAILTKNDIHIINQDGRSNNIVIDPAQPKDTLYSNIFDLDNIYGSKINVLKELTRRLRENRNHLPLIHFVEDRYETLLNVIEHDRKLQLKIDQGVATEVEKMQSLSHVKLYLADWGYNTPGQRQQVVTEYADKIQLISQEDFADLVSKF